MLQSAAWALHGHSTLERAHTMMYLAAFSDPRVGCGAPARFEDRSTACAQLVSSAARLGPAAARSALVACQGLLCVDMPAAAAAATQSRNSAATAQQQLDGGACDDGSLPLWGGSALAASWLCAAHDRALAVGDSVVAAQLVGRLGALADPQPHRHVELRWVGG